ncbi:MAG TPA: CDP-glycerol glycerophosphotransferase family protein [Fervidobacterium sp.]|jgi:CDP-glycerol glycerophosphotransferase|nr:hypothetical protein [Fervidobacterium sp.]HPT59716.1 CDP-glycerol glycerophosphotransferase family protein [Fervidobacterium sp.]HRD20970.1 CDP-glycerol glycerophosphotransferase family protein [Fervidobacterium sp.]
MEEKIRQIQELLNKNDFDQAKIIAEEITDSVQRFNVFGMIYYLEGKYEDAITYFKRALELGYNDDVLFNLATVLYKMTNYKEALKYLTKITEKNWEVYDTIGDCYYALNNTSKALYYYNKACKLSDNPQMLQKYSEFRNRYETGKKVRIFKTMPGKSILKANGRRDDGTDTNKKRLKSQEGIYVAAKFGNKVNLFLCSIASPIKQNKIVFCNRRGIGYGDSPKYVAEEILRRNLDVEMVWLLRENLTGNKEFPTQIRTVQYGSFESLMEVLTAKIWFCNDFGEYFTKFKRQNQVYIQTWHGGIGIKRISLDIAQTPEFIEDTIRESRLIDYMISNSTFCTQLFRRAFAYNGKIVEFGNPRCDRLFDSKAMEESTRKVRDYYHLDDDIKIVLYAPTFRDNRRMDVFNVDYEKLLASLSERFGGKWKVIVRLHPYIIDSLNFMSYTENVLEGTSYDDVYELMSAADIFLTDYSSLMCEFSFMRKPVFLYMPDLDDYLVERGFYFKIDEIPYEIARTNEDLFQRIRDFDKDSYDKRVEIFLNKLGLCEDGEASKRTVDLITKIIN